MFKTLAEHTSLVNVPTRDAISAWNGVAVLRQSPNRKAERDPARELPGIQCSRQVKPSARDTASDTLVDVRVGEST